MKQIVEIFKRPESMQKAENVEHFQLSLHTHDDHAFSLFHKLVTSRQRGTKMIVSQLCKTHFANGIITRQMVVHDEKEKSRLVS